MCNWNEADCSPPLWHDRDWDVQSLCAELQAKEFGEAEVWMNERLMRAAPQYFAEFITAFEDGEQRSMPQRGPVRRLAASTFLYKRSPWL